MKEPFFEEEYKWYDIEFYNIEDVAENGDHAKIHRFTNEVLPPLDKIAMKAKELGYDTFSIKEKIEIETHFNVDDFDENVNE